MVLGTGRTSGHLGMPRPPSSFGLVAVARWPRTYPEVKTLRRAMNTMCFLSQFSSLMWVAIAYIYILYIQWASCEYIWQMMIYAYSIFLKLIIRQLVRIPMHYSPKIHTGTQ